MMTAKTEAAETDEARARHAVAERQPLVAYSPNGRERPSKDYPATAGP